MDYFPGNWGNPRTREADLFASNDYFPGKYAGDLTSVHRASTKEEPISRTQQPIVTGTSVIAMKYKDGVIMAADNLASYGSLARFRDVERLIPAGEYSIVGASGDISDFQHLKEILHNIEVREFYEDDGHKLGPKHFHEYLTQLMYARRSEQNPLWNYLVVGGFKDGEPYLGYVDLQGTSFQSPTIATGFGGHLAQPLLRKAIEGGKETTLTEEEAKKIIEDCMRVLYYRDARSLNKIQLAVINKDGVKISEPYSLQTEWAFAEFIRGYGA